ncbi:MAG: hypothetical protein ACFFC7_30455 [Candidatus Hermodarchaeota archaeon]
MSARTYYITHSLDELKECCSLPRYSFEEGEDAARIIYEIRKSVSKNQHLAQLLTYANKLLSSSRFTERGLFYLVESYYSLLKRDNKTQGVKYAFHYQNITASLLPLLDLEISGITPIHVNLVLSREHVSTIINQLRKCTQLLIIHNPELGTFILYLISLALLQVTYYTDLANYQISTLLTSLKELGDRLCEGGSFLLKQPKFKRLRKAGLSNITAAIQHLIYRAGKSQKLRHHQMLLSNDHLEQIIDYVLDMIHPVTTTPVIDSWALRRYYSILSMILETHSLAGTLHQSFSRQQIVTSIMEGLQDGFRHPMILDNEALKAMGRLIARLAAYPGTNPRELLLLLNTLYNTSLITPSDVNQPYVNGWICSTILSLSQRPDIESLVGTLAIDGRALKCSKEDERGILWYISELVFQHPHVLVQHLRQLAISLKNISKTFQITGMHSLNEKLNERIGNSQRIIIPMIPAESKLSF